MLSWNTFYLYLKYVFFSWTYNEILADLNLLKSITPWKFVLRNPLIFQSGCLWKFRNSICRIKSSRKLFLMFTLLKGSIWREFRNQFQYAESKTCVHISFEYSLCSNWTLNQFSITNLRYLNPLKKIWFKAYKLRLRFKIFKHIMYSFRFNLLKRN